MLFRGILRICNGAVSLAVTLALVLCGSYGAYALWDNGQVLTSAADVQADLIKLKPPAEPEEGETDNSAAFAQLRSINPDVRGWITMDGTGIDLPVLQGAGNLTYISKDVYGNFSLAGSIFLDSRNEPDFSDAYSLLYGHHMADGKMFGDLDCYKEETFFRENKTGMLILPDQTYELEVIACLVVSASEKRIFAPEQVRCDIAALLDFARETALCLREEALAGAEKILALRTCASEFTDARTVVLAGMKPVLPGEQEESQ